MFNTMYVQAELYVWYRGTEREVSIHLYIGTVAIIAIKITSYRITYTSTVLYGRQSR